MNLLWNFLLLSIAVFAVAKLLPSVTIKSFATAVAVAFVYSLVNLLLGWLLVLLSLPAIVVTFGLFNFVINAAMLWLTDKMLDDFEIKGLVSTIFAAVLITVFYNLLRWVF